MFVTALAKYIATELDELTFDATAATGNVFVATMPSSPDLAVAVMPAGGWTQPDFTPERIPTPQLLVRSARHDPRPGLNLAEQLLATLDGLDLVTLDKGGPDEVRLIGCTATQSAPAGLGPDDNDRHEYSLNFTCRIWVPSPLRPG